MNSEVEFIHSLHLYQVSKRTHSSGTRETKCKCNNLSYLITLEKNYTYPRKDNFPTRKYLWL